MFGEMWYLSDIISDLAFLFSSIEDIERKYKEHNLSVEYIVLIFSDGIKVAFRPC